MATKRANSRKLLFVDTNILLDFYRARTEASLALLRHLDQVATDVIVTFQLEMEFKKNRHAAMLEGLGELKSPPTMMRPGLFSDAKAVKAIQKSQKAADARINKLKARIIRALQNPAQHDPVYQVCQRVFHKTDSLVLTREDKQRHVIRRKALKRFLLGCPPRKRGDTSIGDAVNWEWMIHCAQAESAELVIVSRDSDYGAIVDGTAYINDHLKQEFGERVSNKRTILLYHKLSDALKHFDVKVTKEEEQEEEAIAKPQVSTGPTKGSFDAYVKTLFSGSSKELPPAIVQMLMNDEPDDNAEFVVATEATGKDTVRVVRSRARVRKKK